MSLKLTDELTMEVRMMGRRGFQLQELAWANYPYSYNRVMRLHSDEMVANKLRYEEMLSMTDDKAWFDSDENPVLGYFDYADFKKLISLALERRIRFAFELIFLKNEKAYLLKGCIDLERMISDGLSPEYESYCKQGLHCAPNDPVIIFRNELK